METPAQPRHTAQSPDTSQSQGKDEEEEEQQTGCWLGCGSLEDGSGRSQMWVYFGWMTLLPPTHLTDSGNSGHDGVLKELKLLACLAEEEIDLIIITYRAAQAFGNIGRGHKGRVCRGQRKIHSQSRNLRDNIPSQGLGNCSVGQGRTPPCSQLRELSVLVGRELWLREMAGSFPWKLLTVPVYSSPSAKRMFPWEWLLWPSPCAQLRAQSDHSPIHPA